MENFFFCAVVFLTYKSILYFYTRILSFTGLVGITCHEWLGHDKMILCLAAAHASIFNTPLQVFFFIKSVREDFFVSFVSFYQQSFSAAFDLTRLHV